MTAARDTLREEFEAAARHITHADTFTREGDGYEDYVIDTYWRFWQEASRRASAREDAIIKAAGAVLREQLDDVSVHPCDVDNDAVRAAGLIGPYRALWDAFAAAAPEKQG